MQKTGSQQSKRQIIAGSAVFLAFVLFLFHCSVITPDRYATSHDQGPHMEVIVSLELVQGNLYCSLAIDRMHFSGARTKWHEKREGLGKLNWGG